MQYNWKNCFVVKLQIFAKKKRKNFEGFIYPYFMESSEILYGLFHSINCFNFFNHIFFNLSSQKPDKIG